MNIAIPSDDGITVAAHAGRAAGFVIARDTAEGGTEKEFRQRGDIPHHHHHAQHHGHGAHEHTHGDEHAVKHAGILALVEGCDTVVCGGMGQRLQVDLAQAGITVQLTRETLIDHVIASWKDGSFRGENSGFCAH